MTAENIIGFVIYALVALFMMGIGIVQLKSKDPVGFYSGEKPPKAENITDVKAWNKKTRNDVANLWNCDSYLIFHWSCHWRFHLGSPANDWGINNTCDFYDLVSSAVEKEISEIKI